MDDPDPEAASQERPITPAQEAVFGQVAAESRDIVPPVVVEDQQAAPGPEDAFGFRHLGAEVVTERGPEAHRDVRRVIGRVEPRRSIRWREGDPRAQFGELPGSDPVGAIEVQQVSPSDRTQCIERPRDLPLDIKDPGQSFGQPVSEIDR